MLGASPPTCSRACPALGPAPSSPRDMSSSSSRETEVLGCSRLAWSPGQVGVAGSVVPTGGRSRPERSNKAEVLPGVGKESQASLGRRTLRVPGVWEQRASPPWPHSLCPESACQVSSLAHSVPSSQNILPSSLLANCLPSFKAPLRLRCFCVVPHPHLSQTGPILTSPGVPQGCHFTLSGAEPVMLMYQTLRAHF